MSIYRALVLDMDGTIADSLGMIVASFVETAAEWGIEPEDELIRLAKYSSNRALQAELPLGDKSALFIRDFERRIKEYPERGKLFPGIRELLEAPVRRGMVTSESRGEITFNLKRLGIPEGLFEVIICADDTDYEKPHPYPLLRCLERMDTEPGAALFVGDSLNDMRCAKAAGVDFGVALWGADPDGSYTGAKYMFENPGEIISAMIKTEEQM